MSLPKWAKAFNSSDYKQAKLKNLNNVDSNGQRADYATIRSTPLANNLTTPLTSTTTAKPQNKGAWSNWVSEYTNRLNQSGNSNQPKILKDIGIKTKWFGLFYKSTYRVLKEISKKGIN